MKVKYVMIIYAFVFCILLGIGLNTRLSYKDFNDEKEPLDNFVVGLMDKKDKGMTVIITDIHVLRKRLR